MEVAFIVRWNVEPLVQVLSVKRQHIFLDVVLAREPLSHGIVDLAEPHVAPCPLPDHRIDDLANADVILPLNRPEEERVPDREERAIGSQFVGDLVHIAAAPLV